MKTDFKVGDFVMLQDPNKYQDDRIHPNLYKIIDIEYQGIKLSNIKDKVQLDDVCPIPINGVDDRWIYCKFPTMATYVEPNQEVPAMKIDYSYYYDAIYNEKIFKKLLDEQNVKFVHEVQHYFREKFKGYVLEINEYKY